MNISPEEARAALQEIESSRAAMRGLVRTHRGHLYLWLWGTVWIVNALINWRDSARGWVAGNWISVAALAVTLIFIFGQRRQVRSKFNKRFLSVVATLLVFGYGVWPVLLGPPHSYKAAYALGMLLWIQIFIVAGIWFDNYWLWLGVIMGALVLGGIVFFPGDFWACTVLAGALMVGMGCYVRLFWK